MAQLAQFENGAIGRYLSTLMNPFVPLITYSAYKGNGSVADGWPDQSEWLDFRNMWVFNQNILINRLCDNSPTETSGLYNAILSVSQSTSVDARFILAIVMEESRGCVRVPTTSLAVSNPGLMQSYQGKGSCEGMNSCPEQEIVQMIEDGTASNSAGVDLRDVIADTQTSDVSRFYIAARMYNSGRLSIGSGGELSVGGANACYAADVANRLLGYTGGSCGEA